MKVERGRVEGGSTGRKKKPAFTWGGLLSRGPEKNSKKKNDIEGEEESNSGSNRLQIHKIGNHFLLEKQTPLNQKELSQ